MTEELKIYVSAAMGVMTIIQVMITMMIIRLEKYTESRFDRLEREYFKE